MEFAIAERKPTMGRFTRFSFDYLLDAGEMSCGYNNPHSSEKVPCEKAFQGQDSEFQHAKNDYYERDYFDRIRCLSLGCGAACPRG
jgi:hypothetical protein